MKDKNFSFDYDCDLTIKHGAENVVFLNAHDPFGAVCLGLMITGSVSVVGGLIKLGKKAIKQIKKEND